MDIGSVVDISKAIATPAAAPVSTCGQLAALKARLKVLFKTIKSVSEDGSLNPKSRKMMLQALQTEIQMVMQRIAELENAQKKKTSSPIDIVMELAAEDKDGNPVITENSHLAMAAPENNDGARILRRAYNFDNGVVQIAERWPPWRQHVTFDAGLLFECYQRDPRTGFIRIFQKMAQIDMLNQFTTHVGSGLFACPPGAKPGEFIGQALFT